MSKSKKSKNISAKGLKIQAGRLLSKYITEIALEKTELIRNPDGEDILATKAEALARLVWKAALGYTVQTVSQDGTKEIYHPPSLAHQNVIFERIEGKAGLVDEPVKPKKDSKLANIIGKEVAKRINKISEEINNV